MKRPQGFDPPVATSAKPPSPRPSADSGRVTSIARKPVVREPTPTQTLRAAKRERRSVEKGEIRRFTRRARARRRQVISGMCIAAIFATVIGFAAFSPVLALKEITVVGAERVDAEAVRSALDDQLGTPLAMLNFDEITTELSAFALIRSYTTQSLPPHTLVVTIVEREPIGAVDDGTRFAVVDAAGVVIESVTDRPAGVTLIDAGDPDLENPAFVSAVEVLLALDLDLRARVDSVTASTEDDVTLLLGAGAQSVFWGSSARSEFKARVLAALVATQPATARIEYDVSAPDAPVVRAR